jgi:hypothetical protein
LVRLAGGTGGMWLETIKNHAELERRIRSSRQRAQLVKGCRPPSHAR